MRKRILFIGDSLQNIKGGAELSSIELFHHLKESFHVKALTNNTCHYCKKNNFNTDIDFEFINSKCNLCSWRKYLFNYTSILRPSVLIKIYRFLKRNKANYDLIIFGNISHYFSSSTVLIAKKLGFKTMIIYRDFNFLTSGKVISKNDIHSRSRIFSKQIYNPFKIPINRLINNKSDLNVCISNLQKSVFSEAGFRIDRIQYNFVKYDPSDRRVSNVSEFDYDICYVGRYSNLKGVDLLIYEWLSLYTQGNKFKLVIVGFLSDLLPSEILSKIDSVTGAWNHITFLGWLPQDEIFKIISKSKILVYPSVYIDSFGRTVLNGLVSGNVTLISKNAGASEIVEPLIPELIIDEKNLRSQLLFSIENFEYLLERIASLKSTFESYTLPKGGRNYYNRIINEHFFSENLD